MKQPEGFKQKNQEYKVCKLLKSLYGLKQAANAWHEKLKKILEKHGFKQSKHDPCLFKIGQMRELVYLVVYVDDFLVMSKSPEGIENTERVVKSSFKIVALGKPKNFVGLQIQRDKDGIFYLNQSGYIRKILKDTKMEEAKPSKYPLDPGIYKQLPGKDLDNKTIKVRLESYCTLE